MEKQVYLHHYENDIKINVCDIEEVVKLDIFIDDVDTSSKDVYALLITHFDHMRGEMYVFASRNELKYILKLLNKPCFACTNRDHYNRICKVGLLLCSNRSHFSCEKDIEDLLEEDDER